MNGRVKNMSAKKSIKKKEEQLWLIQEITTIGEFNTKKDAEEWRCNNCQDDEDTHWRVIKWKAVKA
jgi:hypothetical protein